MTTFLFFIMLDKTFRPIFIILNAGETSFLMLQKENCNDERCNAKVVYIMQDLIIIMPLKNKAT